MLIVPARLVRREPGDAGSSSPGRAWRSVRIITKKRLMELADKHGDCCKQVEEWHNVAKHASWRNLTEVRQTYRDTDIVGDKTVFNIKRNYWLIVHILYDKEIIYIKGLLTHAEYDKGKWKS
jgi:mRNA interferase HigB